MCEPERDHGSNSDRDEDGTQQNRDAEQNALESVQLPVGDGHERSLVDSLRMLSMEPASCELNHRELTESLLAFVDGGIRMVVAPVEPVVFQSWNTFQTLPLRGTGNGATLEIPFAGRRRVE